MVKILVKLEVKVFMMKCVRQEKNYMSHKDIRYINNMIQAAEESLAMLENHRGESWTNW